ncbi:hypothetical protein D3C83_328490 [compost metagenome]
MRVIERSRWEKRVNTCGRKSASIPMPVSVTRKRAKSEDASTTTVTCPPRGVNLIALVSRFDTT